MKAQELRIGNYVNGIYSEGEFIGEVLTVDLEGCLIDTNSIGIYDLTSGLSGITISTNIEHVH